MNLWYLVIREIRFRFGSFVLALVAVAVATACAVGAPAMLQAYADHTAALLDQRRAELEERLKGLDDQIRKSMLKLGFNVVILPEDQPLDEWYAQGSGSKTMPEAYADKVAESSVATIQHLLPTLQKKLLWPEQRRTIVLAGTRGEIPILHRDRKKPLLEAVPPGSAVVGYQLHHDLELKVGDTITIEGTPFTVSKLHPARGTADDITIWVNLADAQRLLKLPGQVNAIQAIECKCAWADLPQVRAEIQKVLPGTQVIELAGNAIARAEARNRVEADARAALVEEAASRQSLQGTRERLAGVLVPLVVLACGVWIGLLMLGNVRERRTEIALLTALGTASGRVLRVFLAKAVLIGLVGGVIGTAAGLVLGSWLGQLLSGGAGRAGLVPGWWLGMVLAVALSVVASWLPAFRAASQDPAEILREE